MKICQVVFLQIPVTFPVVFSLDQYKEWTRDAQIIYLDSAATHCETFLGEPPSILKGHSV